MDSPHREKKEVNVNKEVIRGILLSMLILLLRPKKDPRFL
jgi:hypothetical protein